MSTHQTSPSFTRRLSNTCRGGASRRAPGGGGQVGGNSLSPAPPTGWRRWNPAKRRVLGNGLDQQRRGQRHTHRFCSVSPRLADASSPGTGIARRATGGAVVRLSDGGSSINRSNRVRKVSERGLRLLNDDRRVIALPHVQYSPTVRRPIQVVEAHGSGPAAGPATPGITRSCPRRGRRFPDRESRCGVPRSDSGRRSCGRTDRDAGQVSSRLATRG